MLRSNSKHKGTFVARKLKRRCHNFLPQSWYLLWVKHLETVPPPAIRLWVFSLGGWRRKQTLPTVQQTDFWFQNDTFCGPIIHRRTHNKLSPILMSIQTYQITVLGPLRVLLVSGSLWLFFCGWVIGPVVIPCRQELTTGLISQTQIPFLPGKYFYGGRNRINAKDRISLIVKLLYESHLQIL